MRARYRPIPCAAHSVLERLAIRRRSVRVAYLDGRTKATIEGLVADLVTREGAEYLVLEADGELHRIRLDRLERIDEGPDRVYQRQNPGSGGSAL